MKLDRRLLWVFAVLSITTLACQAVMSKVEPEVAQTEVETVPVSSQVLFEDDFSDPSSGWDDYEDEEGLTGYRGGSYQIFINKSQWYFWSTPGKNFTDVIVDVDTTKLGGPDNNEFGVICRYLDEQNFYILSISSDGYYGISKFLDGTQSGVGQEEMDFNDKVIHTGAATNHIRASCIGNSLTLEVNGQVLADYVDSDLTVGDVGLIASTFDESGVAIGFDNFVVTRP